MTAFVPGGAKSATLFESLFAPNEPKGAPLTEAFFTLIDKK